MGREIRLNDNKYLSSLAKLFLVTSGAAQIPLNQKYRDNLEAMVGKA